MNIFNFANYQLCAYQSIFPTVASLLNHLLFTNGNGYDFDTETGMIYCWSNRKKEFIDQYTEMTDEAWNKLIAKCHEKERSFHEQFAKGRPINLAELAEDCAKYKRISVDAKQFSEEGLYEQLRCMATDKQIEAIKEERYPSFVRPYPLSPGFALIYELNEKTPGYLLQIAFNLCNAWITFLNEEIQSGNVWVKPSDRPTPTAQQIATAKAMESLFDYIREDAEYDGWLEKHKEPESDYADLTWTIKVRDQLVGQAQQLGKLLVSSSNFKVGDKVIVKIRDPFHRYGGCAEPTPGMKAVVSDINIEEPAAFGKIEVKFEPEVLGYLQREDENDDSITLYLRPWILEKL